MTCYDMYDNEEFSNVQCYDMHYDMTCYDMCYDDVICYDIMICYDDV